MDLTNFGAKRIYETFPKGEKRIYDVNDRSLKFKFIKSQITIGFFIAELISAFNTYAFWRRPVKDLALFFTLPTIVITILLVFSYLKNSSKLYFYKNFIILENKLKSRTIIDINNNPKIFVTREEISYYDSNDFLRETYNYYLQIGQDNNCIMLDIKSVGSSKIYRLLLNLEYR